MPKVSCYAHVFWHNQLDMRNVKIKYFTDSYRLPVPPGERMEKLKFFLHSCANWGFGYFNAYDVASRYDLDFWVHLGDYVGTQLWCSACCLSGFLAFMCSLAVHLVCLDK